VTVAVRVVDEMVTVDEALTNVLAPKMMVKNRDVETSSINTCLNENICFMIDYDTQQVSYESMIL